MNARDYERDIDEQRTTIIRLLVGYTDQINSLNKEYSTLRAEQSTNIVFLAIILAGSLVSAFLLQESGNFVGLAISAIIIWMAIAIVIGFWNSVYRRNRAKRAQIVQRLSSATKTLNVVVRHAYQFQEHIDDSSIKKLELDLRVNEALAALDDTHPLIGD